jgi:2',3'-cyclic-nucleotide 2'-phosphodiesterase (5'-nucleotidase family)
VYDDLFTTLPFMNTIDTIELLGEDIWKVLEYSAQAYSFYNFLQFSGVHVVYNVTNPVNERVVSVDVLCRQCDVPKYEKLDLKQWYRMVVPSFIGAGGNGFTMFKNRRNVKKGDKYDIQVVEEYLQKMSPVIQKKDGRIVVLK